MIRKAQIIITIFLALVFIGATVWFAFRPQADIAPQVADSFAAPACTPEPKPSSGQLEFQYGTTQITYQWRPGFLSRHTIVFQRVDGALVRTQDEIYEVSFPPEARPGQKIEVITSVKDSTKTGYNFSATDLVEMPLGNSLEGIHGRTFNIIPDQLDARGNPISWKRELGGGRDEQGNIKPQLERPARRQDLVRDYKALSNKFNFLKAVAATEITNELYALVEFYSDDPVVKQEFEKFQSGGNVNRHALEAIESTLKQRRDNDRATGKNWIGAFGQYTFPDYSSTEAILERQHARAKKLATPALLVIDRSRPTIIISDRHPTYPTTSRVYSKIIPHFVGRNEATPILPNIDALSQLRVPVRSDLLIAPFEERHWGRYVSDWPQYISGYDNLSDQQKEEVWNNTLTLQQKLLAHLGIADTAQWSWLGARHLWARTKKVGKIPVGIHVQTFCTTPAAHKEIDILAYDIKVFDRAKNEEGNIEPVQISADGITQVDIGIDGWEQLKDATDESRNLNKEFFDKSKWQVSIGIKYSEYTFKPLEGFSFATNDQLTEEVKFTATPPPPNPSFIARHSPPYPRDYRIPENGNILPIISMRTQDWTNDKASQKLFIKVDPTKVRPHPSDINKIQFSEPNPEDPNAEPIWVDADVSKLNLRLQIVSPYRDIKRDFSVAFSPLQILDVGEHPDLPFAQKLIIEAREGSAQIGRVQLSAELAKRTIKNSQGIQFAQTNKEFRFDNPNNINWQPTLALNFGEQNEVFYVVVRADYSKLFMEPTGRYDPSNNYARLVNNKPITVAAQSLVNRDINAHKEVTLPRSEESAPLSLGEAVGAWLGAVLEYNLGAAVANPAPLIEQLVPSVKVAGSGEFQLRILGQGFLGTQDQAITTIRVNGEDRETTFVSETELKAKILADDIRQAGELEITASNPQPGGGESESRILEVVAAGQGNNQIQQQIHNLQRQIQSLAKQKRNIEKDIINTEEAIDKYYNAYLANRETKGAFLSRVDKIELALNTQIRYQKNLQKGLDACRAKLTAHYRPFYRSIITFFRNLITQAHAQTNTLPTLTVRKTQLEREVQALEQKQESLQARLNQVLTAYLQLFKDDNPALRARIKRLIKAFKTVKLTYNQRLRDALADCKARL